LPDSVVELIKSNLVCLGAVMGINRIGSRISLSFTQRILIIDVKLSNFLFYQIIYL